MSNTLPSTTNFPPTAARPWALLTNIRLGRGCVEQRARESHATSLLYSRALVVLSAEELCELAEVVALAALLVAALLVAAPHARLVVLG